MNLEWKTSDVTGNLEASFNGKLLSISDKVFNLKNEAKTEYRAVIIQIDGSKGSKNVSAVMYETNYQHGVQTGITYLCKASYNQSKTDKSVFLTVSHLAVGEKANIDDFGAISEIKAEKTADIFAGTKAEKF